MAEAHASTSGVDRSGDVPVLVEDRGDYGVLTLNRPAKRNAVNRDLADAFRSALRALEGTPVVIVTGAGDRAFCAGMDLTERDGSTWQATVGMGNANFWPDAIEAMREHPAVFIAAVNGFAVGGGLTLVNNCELAVSADTAQFGMPELGFGAFPAVAAPTTVRRILPKHVAQLVLTAERVDATTALTWGLVNSVVPAAELMPAAERLAEKIAARDAMALAYCKKGLRELEVMEWSRAIERGTAFGNAVKALRSRSEGT